MSEALKQKPQLESEDDSVLVSLNNLELGRQGATLFPFFDRLLWRDVRGNEGPAQPPVKMLPVDFHGVPTQVKSPEECFQVLQQAEVLCQRISGMKEMGGVRQAAYLKISLLQQVFTQILPMPLPEAMHEAQTDHPWYLGKPSRLKRNDQLAILLILQTLANHFATSALGVMASKSFDAVKMIVRPLPR